MTDVNFDNLQRTVQAGLEAELELAKKQIAELGQQLYESQEDVLNLRIAVAELNDEIEALMAEMDDF